MLRTFAIVAICCVACQGAGGGGSDPNAPGGPGDPNGPGSDPNNPTPTDPNNPNNPNPNNPNPMGTMFPEGCYANTHTAPSGPGCTGACADCNCTTITYTCDKACYSTMSCFINSGSDGVPTTPVGSLPGGCGTLTCVPESDLTKDLTCTASMCNPPPAMMPPPTPTGCQAGMECKPGSIRYCDEPISEWTLSTCDSTGHWGTCVPIPVPPAAVGHGDCSDADYSPELCCAFIPGCCQDNPGGPFVDFGSGQCAKVSCP